MRAYCQSLEWSDFVFSWRTRDAVSPHGSVMVLCKYHKLNDKAPCRKQLSLQNDQHAHFEDVVWTLRHWCNGALQHNRQRSHMQPRRLDIALTPPRELVLAQMLTAPLPDPLPTDVELDSAGVPEAPAYDPEPAVADVDEAAESDESSGESSAKASEGPAFSDCFTMDTDELMRSSGYSDAEF